MAQITSSVTFIPSAYDSGTFTVSGSYPASNGLSNTSSTSFARFTVSTTSQYAIYNFDTSDIPSNATINSITCQAKISYRSNNTYYYFYDFDSFDIPKIATITKVTLKIKACRYSSYTWDAVLCNGTNEVSSVSITAQTTQQTTPSSSDPGIFTIENTTLTDVSNLKIKFKQTSNNSNNTRCFFYGADLTITYTVPDRTYTYTISNVQADHTVVVDDINNGVPSFVKKNSQYKQVNSVYKKNGNAWEEKSILSVMWKINNTWTSTTSSMSGKTAFTTEQ